ncbi:MAG: gamma carbonic anhydrase family protein [Bdellovibrionales bacterium]
MILKARGCEPQIGTGTFVAPSADIIGDCKIGKNCSFWFNVTVRGDVMPIEIGDETNIQDGSTIHGTFGQAAAKIGRRVTVGHNVILHGCTVEDLCLIGMGSVVMDNAHIPKRSIVAAGSLVTEGSKFPEGHLILGRPAKAVRPLKPDELAFLDKSADNYLLYKTWYESPEVKI